MGLLARIQNYITLLPSTIIYRTLLLWMVYFSIGEFKPIAIPVYTVTEKGTV
jgi:hypothetical protein